MDRSAFLVAASALLAARSAGIAQAASSATGATDRPFNVLVLGDSIAWGQGLEPDHRWRTLVDNRVAIALGRRVVEIPTDVHSGATIGIGDRGQIEEQPRNHVANELYTPRYADPTVDVAAGPVTPNFERSLLHSDVPAGQPNYDGEIPSTTPTVLRQLDEFDAGPNRDAPIDLVFVSAGINDVAVARLLNPLADRRYVRDAIDAHMHHHLVVLLDRIRVRIVDRNPDCIVVVLSYYPMIGPKSLAVPSTAELRTALTTAPSETRKQLFARNFENGGAFVTNAFDADAGAAASDRPQSAIVRALVAAANRFFSLSETAVSRAVDEANREPFSPNFIHVTPGIDPDRTVFSNDPQLWGLLPNQFAPQDEVAVARAQICTKLGLERSDLTPDATRECFIASIGHPNVAGAQRYAESIWTALEPRLKKS